MQYITLAQAAAILPSSRPGKKLHVKTVKRWAISGCRGVMLAAIKSGGCWFTTEQWVQEFQSNCTRAACPRGERTEGLRREARRNAAKRLAKYGIHVKDDKTEAVG